MRSRDTPPLYTPEEWANVSQQMKALKWWQFIGLFFLGLLALPAFLFKRIFMRRT